MAKYRKRPVEVEAFQILMGTLRKRDYPQWFADAIASGVVYQKANPDYPVECTIDHGSRSWGMRCTACGKEFERMKPGFGWRFCPMCGAEVVERERGR